MFHVLTTPLRDSVGIITPSSLHYFATHRGSFIADIDPKEYRLMIHGMVDRPLHLAVDWHHNESPPGGRSAIDCFT